jgi:uncharacterized protein (UPF0261 family)
MATPKSNASSKSVLVVDSLEATGAEIAFLRDQLLAAGLTPEVVDIGVLGLSTFEPDVRRDEIALALLNPMICVPSSAGRRESPVSSAHPE